MSTFTLTAAAPDYYSEQYHYVAYPARIHGEAGTFRVWSRDVDRPNPNHVTWSPELVAIVAAEYHTDAWKAEQEEKRNRPVIERLQTVRLGDLVVEVAARCGTYTDGVPCRVVGEFTYTAKEA